MKKLKAIITTAIILVSSLLFTACDNESKTLARNLDDTITNLVYSVSSLDWADSETLKSITNPTSNSGDLTPENFYSSNSISLDESQIDLNNNQTDNSIEDIEIPTDEPPLPPALEDENGNPLPPRRRHPHHAPHGRHRRGRPNREEYIPDDSQVETGTEIPNTEEVPSTLTQNTITNNNPARHPRVDRRQSRQYYRNLTNNTNSTNGSFSKNYSRSLASRNLTSSATSKTVSYSTSIIENSTSKIQETITNLINERANVLLYINDLYKGNVSLSKEDMTAINAYMNIIKDNTSYLSSNKGMITNQLSQASDLVNNNSNSSLINAYIIRTNETIETRLAKLDSSILAIQSICDIMKANLTENSPYFKQNITQNQVDETPILEEIEQNNTTIQDNTNSETPSLEELNKMLQKSSSEVLSDTTNTLTNTDLSLNKSAIVPESEQDQDSCENCIEKLNEECPECVEKLNNECPEFVDNMVEDCPECVDELSENNIENFSEKQNNCPECVSEPETESSFAKSRIGTNRYSRQTETSPMIGDIEDMIEVKEIENQENPNPKYQPQEFEKIEDETPIANSENQEENQINENQQEYNSQRQGKSLQRASNKGFIDKNYNKSKTKQTSATEAQNTSSSDKVGHVVNMDEKAENMPYFSHKHNIQDLNFSNLNLAK